MSIKIFKPIDNESFIGMGENGFVDRIVNEIQAVPQNEDLEIEINTPGGYVDAGITIASAIAEHKGNVKMYVRGVAASMGAALLAFGDYVEASEFSTIMLHRAYIRGIPEDKYTQEQAMLIDKTNNDLKKMFSRKGVNQDLLNEIFSPGNRKNYWFTAMQSRRIGLVDKVSQTMRNQMKPAANLDNPDELKLASIYGFEENVKFEDEQLNKLLNNKGGIMSLFSFTKKGEVNKESFEEVQNQVEKLVNEGENKITDIVNKILDSKKEELTKATGSIAANADAIKAMQNTLTELQNSITKLTEASDTSSKKMETLSDNVMKDMQAKVDAVKEELDETVTKIKNTVTDFEVPKAGVTSAPELTDEQKIKAEINKANSGKEVKK